MWTQIKPMLRASLRPHPIPPFPNCLFHRVPDWSPASLPGGATGALRGPPLHHLPLHRGALPPQIPPRRHWPPGSPHGESADPAPTYCRAGTSDATLMSFQLTTELANLLRGRDRKCSMHGPRCISPFIFLNPPAHFSTPEAIRL